MLGKAQVKYTGSIPNLSRVYMVSTRYTIAQGNKLIAYIHNYITRLEPNLSKGHIYYPDETDIEGTPNCQSPKALSHCIGKGTRVRIKARGMSM